MKRPLLTVALVYAAGIVAADFSPLPLPVFGLLGGCGALATLALCWPKARLPLLWLLLFTTGLANLNLRKAILAPDDLRLVLGDRAEIAVVRGTLVETPYHRHYEHRDEEVWRSIARLDVDAIRPPNGPWRPVTGRITISTPGLVPTNFFGGRRVEIEGVLRPPRSAVAEGVFDYAAFLARQGIHYQLLVDAIGDWKLAATDDASAQPPVADRFGNWAKSALALGLPVEDQPLQLLWAMTLGWKTALNGEVSEPFMRSGTMHVFAISGLHIALIATLLVVALKVCRVPRHWSPWLVIPLIWFYTGVTGWQASAIRSTIMMTVIIGGSSFKRPSDLLNSLAAAALAILLWDPQQLFQAGFQLSFVVVFSLALITPVLDSLSGPALIPGPRNGPPLVNRWVDELTKRLPLAGLFFPDPLQPKHFRPLWQRRLGPPTRYLLSAFATSFAAWIGSIPVIAYYFHLLTPVSLLANLIVVPISSLALSCNLASMATAAWLPWAAELFNHSAWLCMLLMIRLSEWAAQLPAACVHVATPSLSVFLLYYATLVSVMAGWLFKAATRKWCAVVLSLLTVLVAFQWHGHRQTAHLTILPLNGGESLYFTPARGAPDLLIDCGAESSSEIVLKPFLRAQGLDHPARLLLTHGDIHNVGGAALLQEQFSPRRVLVSEATFRSGAYRQAIRSFDSITGLVERLPRQGRIEPWTLLHPDETDRFPQADDNTVVLHGDIQGTRVLLLSDLGKPGQNALLARHPDLRADIVISGLPTQGEPLADALLDALQPKLIVITDAENPASQRAPAKLRRRLSTRGVPVLFTHETGAVTLDFDVGQWSARTMSGQKLSSSK